MNWSRPWNDWVFWAFLGLLMATLVCVSFGVYQASLNAARIRKIESRQVQVHGTVDRLEDFVKELRRREAERRSRATQQ